MQKKPVVIIEGPSGVGKDTIINTLLNRYPERFGRPINACTRAMREDECQNNPYYFITEEELQRDHGGIPHGGFVIRSGRTGKNLENSHIIEYSLKLDSNPEFTSSVLVAYARAAYRMSKRGDFGCKTVLDIPPAYLSPKSGEELRASLL